MCRNAKSFPARFSCRATAQSTSRSTRIRPQHARKTVAFRVVRSQIVGSGVALPPYRATNAGIASFFPTPEGDAWTPAWVKHRLGILERRNAFDFTAGELRAGYHDGDLAYTAARNAIADANIEPYEIERVVYA